VITVVIVNEYKTDKRSFPRFHRVSSEHQSVIDLHFDALLAQLRR